MYANRLIADLLITITILVFLFLGILLAAWSAAQLITLPVLFFKRYFRFGDEALTTTFAESVNDLQGTNVPLEVEYLHDIDFEISPRDLNQDNHYPLKSVKAISFTCCALGSGSKGNSFYFRTDNFGVLIDIGLGPSQMKQRMSLINIGWQDINAVVLTHTDTDHWNPRTFRQLNKLQIPVYCHHDHLIHLSKDDSFISLQQCGLTRLYYTNETLRLSSLLKCRPFRLSHDGGATFGFRFDCGEGASASSISLGYAADLGSWDKETAVALSNVDVLALEFNYDLDMQLASSRHPAVINRIISDDGHLSNNQAVELMREVISYSAIRPFRHLFQLHLSQQCNSPELALRVAQEALDPIVKVHTATQNGPSVIIHLEA